MTPNCILLDKQSETILFQILIYKNSMVKRITRENEERDQEETQDLPKKHPFHSRSEDMTITICHNKPPDRKWVWSVDDVMPRRNAPENSKILKRCQLTFDLWGIGGVFGLLRVAVEFSTVEVEVEFSTVKAYGSLFQISTGRDELRS